MYAQTPRALAAAGAWARRRREQQAARRAAEQARLAEALQAQRGRAQANVLANAAQRQRAQQHATVASAISDFRAWYLQQLAKRPAWYAAQEVKRAAWDMLGALDELRAKPIWSAAQRDELAALSTQIHAATVAGKTDSLREMLPQAARSVNALILAAQAAARQRAAAARYVPAPNTSTGGMDLGAGDSPRAIVSQPQTLLGRLVQTFAHAGGQIQHVLHAAIRAVQYASMLIQSVLDGVQNIAILRRVTPKNRIALSRQEYADHLYAKLFPDGPNDPPCPPGWHQILGSQPCQTVDLNGNSTWSTIRCRKGAAGPEMCAQQAWEEYWQYEGQFRLAEAFVNSRSATLYPALLAASTHESYSAHINQSDHPILLLAKTLRWEETHRAEIQQTATAFGIPPELLAGVMMSEIYWDYGHGDEHMDRLAPAASRIGGFVNQLFLRGPAPGLASVHFSTYQDAYKDLDAIGKLPPNVVAPDELTAEYLVTDEGAIQASALVTAWLVEQYGHGTDLTSEDMALIYAAYRQKKENLVCEANEKITWKNWREYISSDCPLPGNAQFALPFMEYAQDTITD